MRTDIFGETIPEKGEDVCPTVIGPFDLVKSVTFTKEDLSNDPNFDRAYIPYLINRALAQNPDTLEFAVSMNRCLFIDKDMQYVYYLRLIPKRKRFNKWAKNTMSEQLNVISEYFTCSLMKAEEIAGLLTAEDMEAITKKMDKGGTK